MLLVVQEVPDALDSQSGNSPVFGILLLQGCFFFVRLKRLSGRLGGIMKAFFEGHSHGNVPNLLHADAKSLDLPALVDGDQLL